MSTAKDTAPLPIDSMQFWQALALASLPDTITEDEWKVNEFAVILQQITSKLGANYGEIDAIIGRAESKAAAVGVAVKIERMNTPPEISGTVSYKEAHRDDFNVLVPDPDQDELPLEREVE